MNYQSFVRRQMTAKEHVWAANEIMIYNDFIITMISFQCKAPDWQLIISQPSKIAVTGQKPPKL